MSKGNRAVGAPRTIPCVAVTMKVPEVIANAVNELAEQTGMKKVAAFYNLWENFSPKDSEVLITPIELEGLKNRVRLLEEANDRLVEKIAKTNSIDEEYKKGLEQEVAYLRQQLDEWRNDASQINSKFADVNLAFTQLAETNIEQVKSLVELESEKKIAAAKIGQLRTAISELETLKLEMEETAAAKTVKIDQQQSVTQKLETQVEELAVELHALKQRETGEGWRQRVQGVVDEMEGKRNGSKTRDWVWWIRFVEKLGAQ